MAQYRNPAESLLREDSARKDRAEELGSLFDSLVFYADRYSSAWKAATESGWTMRQLTEAGFVNPSSLKLPAASSRLRKEMSAADDDSSSDTPAAPGDFN